MIRYAASYCPQHPQQPRELQLVTYAYRYNHWYFMIVKYLIIIIISAKNISVRLLFYAYHSNKYQK